MSAEIRRSSYVRVEGTTWPHPDDPNSVEWVLRYGNPSREDLLRAASFIHAYRHLISMTQRERNHRIQTLRLAAPLGQPTQDGQQ